MRKIIGMVLVLAGLTLVGCGGGKSGGGGGGDGSSDAAPSTIDVSSSAATVGIADTDKVTISASVLDSDSVALSGVKVAFSASTGKLSAASATTNSSGVASVSFSAGADTSTRNAEIKATAGSATGTTSVSVKAKATTVEVLASANSVGTGGDAVTITAIVKDANNNSMPGTAVSFSTDTGTLSSVPAVADSAGVATASFSAGADKSNRTATITVGSGDTNGNIVLPINGTKLSITGATTVPLADKATLGFAAVDSKGNPIPDADLKLTSRLKNGLSDSSLTTDANGQAGAEYTATKAGKDRIVANGLSASASLNIAISAEDFVFTAPAANAKVTLGTSKSLTVRYKKGGVAQAGKRVDFAATIGTLSAASAVTDGDGNATVKISSTFAGSSLVTASLSGVTAQASLPLSFVAKKPANLVLQVSPTALAPNSAGSNSNQATVTARVSDANDNPVAGSAVNFNQDKDLSGGSLSAASALTDANGVASVKYVSGPNSTATAGVVLRATVASRVSVTDSASLTVSRSSLFLALGTGNVITNIDEQTYKKDWIVYVTDADGVAVSGVTVTVKAVPTKYIKGYLVFPEGADTWSYADDGYHECTNEDANRNGLLDSGEDINLDGKLWPGNVISVTPSTLTTSSDGRATLSLIYAESYAPWVQLDLSVEATVSGTESKTTANFIVSGESGDFTNPATPPAGRFSPFGRAQVCSNRN